MISNDSVTAPFTVQSRQGSELALRGKLKLLELIH